MPPKPLAPIDRTGLVVFADKGKADPTAARTVKCRTVLEGKFRHLNYIRNLPAHVIDEPPGLLGDDTAPNPTEALLAALGSCLSVGIHANAIARGIRLYKLELELEADINITSVWGVGDLSPKARGLTAVRAKVQIEGDADRASWTRLSPTPMPGHRWRTPSAIERSMSIPRLPRCWPRCEGSCAKTSRASR
jgi:uncharacterized OsmC-like protein